MITPTIYDWPSQIQFQDAAFFAGGQGTEGGMTTGGILVGHPEPGGRSAMQVTFKTAGPCVVAMDSWVMSKMRPQTVFRVAVHRSRQLVDFADLGLTVPSGYDGVGIPWEGDLYWSNDMGWAYDPAAIAGAIGAEGSTTLVIDMTGYDHGLSHGHVIGVGDRAYLVDDITYDGDTATVTVTPPLRDAVAVGDFITFRPKMLATVQDPESFRSMFRHRKYLQPGSITFVEALI